MVSCHVNICKLSEKKMPLFFTKRFNVIDIDLTQTFGTDFLLPRGYSGQYNTIGTGFDHMLHIRLDLPNTLLLGNFSLLNPFKPNGTFLCLAGRRTHFQIYGCLVVFFFIFSSNFKLNIL